jgi:hypothetical protein
MFLFHRAPLRFALPAARYPQPSTRYTLPVAAPALFLDQNIATQQREKWVEVHKVLSVFRH